MTIKLEDFVAESLAEIVRGVKRAQDEVKGTGAVISPLMRTTTDNSSVGSPEGMGGQPCYKVAFDIAVTANEATATSGGIGVVAGVFALGSKGQSSDALANISRIQFYVPIVLPLQRAERQA
jgi:hypothetical protein